MDRRFNMPFSHTMNFGAFIYGTLHVDIAIVGIEHR